MTISYPLSLPTISKGGFAQLTLEPQFIQGRVRSPFTGVEQVHDYQGERWTLRVTYTKLLPIDARLVMAFLLSLRGAVGTFAVGDALMGTPGGVGSGVPLVNAGGQTGRSLNTKGWTVSVTNILKAGDYFQLNSYLYMNLVSVNSDGSGNATLDIFPALRSSPANNDALTLSNPKSLFRLDEKSISWDVGADQLYAIGFSAVEVR